ncbi:hypothetical protein HMPREF9176_1145 [Streptococcus downei F0415]|nr:hypothetical protein HMPREF9176_1145 [Streptococcus downei F0415]
MDIIANFPNQERKLAGWVQGAVFLRLTGLLFSEKPTD